jgi:glycosyltransferase involved in cell wall biosynthesis
MQTRIIVATLGERISLKQTLKSITSQNIADLEVKIVIPKGKADYLNQIATEANLKNYQLIEDGGRGLSAAINQGFSAEGDFDFFGWINDDDELTTNSLSRSIKFLISNINKSAVIGNLGYLSSKSNKIITNKVSKINLIVSKIGPNVIPQPGSLIRKSALRNQPLLNENYKYAMDLDMWLRILVNGQIGIIKESQALMNWHSDSITISNRKKASIEAFQIRYRNAKNVLIKSLVVIFYIPTRFLSSVISKIS